MEMMCVFLIAKFPISSKILRHAPTPDAIDNFSLMGNYNSCNFLSPRVKSPKAARVILPAGEVRQFREPVKAAELMLECPTFFLVNSRSLHIGRRFMPMAADEDLEFGHLYIMFPMRRLRSVVTAADVAVFLMAANAVAKRISVGNVRVSPASVDEAAAGGVPRSDPDSIERFPVPLEITYRLSGCRSRRPGLDTIIEEPICLR